MWIIPTIGLFASSSRTWRSYARPYNRLVAMLLAGIVRRCRGALALLAMLCLFVVG